MKNIAGKLRLDMAQYRELAAFAQFGSELDKASQDKISRGARMVELLKQGQYEPLSVEKQVLIIFAGTSGFVDKVPVSEVLRYERELYAFVDARPETLKTIGEKARNKKLFGELTEFMTKLLSDFAKVFVAETKAATTSKKAS
jgi:F-type H+-transporting ATPase subunit alpha